MVNESNFVIRRVNANAQTNYLYSLEDLSAEILNNPLVNNVYQRINRHGGQILITHNLPDEPDLAGEFQPSTNKIYIYYANNLTLQEAISTIIHESTHLDFCYRKGRRNNSKYEEFRAFVREFLYIKGRRPNLSERFDIWDNVERLYPELPLGKNPFGYNE